MCSISFRQIENLKGVNKVGEIKTWLGIGLIPTRTRHRLNPGHVWLFWDKTPEDHHEPYRGFWPDLDKLPEGAAERKKLYRTQSVPAVLVEDIDYERYMKNPVLRAEMTIVQWTITLEQFERLQEMVMMPVPADVPMMSHKKFSYSWNTSIEDSHNCSSWAIWVVNYVMGKEFIKCKYPRRLKYVKPALEQLKQRIKKFK